MPNILNFTIIYPHIYPH